MITKISRPKGYDFGAWMITITLSPEEKSLFDKCPIPFSLPKIPKRSIVWVGNYVIAVAEEKETP